MDLRPQGYYDLTKFLIPGSVKFASWKVTVDACLEILTAFRFLHKKGYSYQDLNDGIFFINPSTGSVRIGDNDNVAPAGTNTGILGKPRFMAPEIVRNENMPNVDSDKYSLSLILFTMLCFYRILCKEISEKGLAEEINYLGESWLPDMSKYGSADDMSVAGIVDTEIILPFIEKFEKENLLCTVMQILMKLKNVKAL